MEALLQTPLTKHLGIKHPVFLAGMNVAAGPELAAAVCNAGGMGVIGGLGYTPKFLRSQIQEMKANLINKDAPFGIDLLIPQVGGGARKTNYDYTNGTLPELIDIIISEGAKLFVCAIGVPPKDQVEKLHNAGILVMNMVGHPKHVAKAIEAGCDLICAQGGEGGGHTGAVPTTVLLPKVLDACRGHVSPLTGDPIYVLGAGGVFDGRGLAMALSMGAMGVWVGTRFICATEAGAPPRHQKAVMGCGYDDTIRTLIYTGRPLRVVKSPFVMGWENDRQAEIKELLSKGIRPVVHDYTELKKAGKEKDLTVAERLQYRPLLMGACAAAVDDVVPAKTIVESMVQQAAELLQTANKFLTPRAKM